MKFLTLKVNRIMSIAKNSVCGQLSLAGLCLIFVSNAQAAGNAANGKVLYNTAYAGLSCSNSACHGTSPSSNINSIRNGANNGSRIMSAISSNKGSMGFLSSYISAANADDIGAYIANPNVATVTTTVATVSPPTLSFGNQTVGSASAAQTVTLTNSGTITMNISGIAISTSLGFAVSTTCSTTLAVGASCTISSTFTPPSVGVKDGAITITSNAIGSPTTVSLSGTGIATTTTMPVIEFYNTILDNYFITSDAGEAAAIDNGSAGPGWIRTGNSFKSGGDTSVCRFYGSYSPGPNSHFYTVDLAECQGLKDQQIPAGDARKLTVKSWNFESLDFVSTPATNQACPTGTTPVYRAYNNGFSRGVDSNHRITSSSSAISEVVARGWSNEGVVMCAPN